MCNISETRLALGAREGEESSKDGKGTTVALAQQKTRGERAGNGSKTLASRGGGGLCFETGSLYSVTPN